MDCWDNVKAFWDWVNDDESSLEKEFEKRGLKPGAPEKAVKAYKKYVADIKAHPNSD
jgi:hypothetical protein